MNAVYDHMIAIVFIGIMFVWAVSVIPQMSYNNIQAVNQQQMRNMELNVFDSLLLDTGLATSGTATTTEWGSLNPFTQNAVTRFGLSSAGASTLFTLDPDKVQRLTDNPLGNLTYERTKQLLGLQGYDFLFQILPPFNVTNSNGTKIDQNHSPLVVTGSTAEYQIKVSFLDGRPIPNAEISATILYTKETTFFPIVTQSTVTNEMGLGGSTAPLATTDPESIMVILRISVADVATIVVSFGKNSNNIMDINMVGDDVILTEPKIPSNAAVWLENMSYYSSDGAVSWLYSGTKDDKINTGSGNFNLWDQTFNGLKAMDPLFIILDVSAVENDGVGHGRRELIVAGPYQNLQGYTVFGYGSTNPGLSTIVSSQRSVIISGMTYTAQFILWKNSA